MIDPEKIRKALVVDESQLQHELLERVAVHLRIDNRGRVHLLDPARYRVKDSIALYLIGRKYAFEAKLLEDDTVQLSEIASALGIDTQVVSARLSELRDEGKVEAPARGQSRIVFPRVPQILNEIDMQVRTWSKTTKDQKTR